MRISAVHNPGCDPMVANLTPLSFAFQPALRADVGWGREALWPVSLTCIVFDPNISNGFKKIPSNITGEQRTKIIDTIILEEAKKLQDKYRTAYLQTDTNLPWNRKLHKTLKPLYEEFKIESKETNGLVKIFFKAAYKGTKPGIWVSVLDIGKGTGQYSSEFTNWLNAGNTNNKVYQGIINGESVYTGITKQELSTRLYQHNYGGKGLDYLQETFSGLTRNQARAIEQYFIENGPGNTLNKINSISPNSVYYDDAMKWAIDFINGLK